MIITLILISLFCILYWIGTYMASRDRLQKSDAIVILSGSQGQILNLHNRIDTGIRLFKNNHASHIIMTGAFSEKIDQNNNPFSEKEINQFIQDKRISPSSKAVGLKNWDKSLGASYMKYYAVKQGIPVDKIIIEERSLHTTENAKYTFDILKKYNWNSMILVTSPFHQRRAYISFQKVINENIGILNYAADSKDWNRYIWFLSLKNIILVINEIKNIYTYTYKRRTYELYK